VKGAWVRREGSHDWDSLRIGKERKLGIVDRRKILRAKVCGLRLGQRTVLYKGAGHDRADRPGYGIDMGPGISNKF
jgi:hypothetical protein